MRSRSRHAPACKVIAFPARFIHRSIRPPAAPPPANSARDDIEHLKATIRYLQHLNSRLWAALYGEAIS